MNRILALWLLLVGLPALAADRITATITFTNDVATTNGTLFVVNAATRTFTNSVVNSSIQVLTNATAAGSKTNLFNQLSLNPVTSVAMINLGPTNFSLVSAAGVSLVVSFPEYYAQIIYSTQVVATANTRIFPINANPSAAVRTNDASDMVYAQEQYSTNSLNQNSVAANELMGLTNAQTVAGIKQFTNTSGVWHGLVNSAFLSGTATTITNGLFKTNIFAYPSFTNGVNYGAAFRSPGSGADSEQFGADAVADGAGAIALGQGATASLSAATAIGTGALALGPGATALGNSSASTVESGTALGSSAQVVHTNSTAIGVNSLTTAASQIRLGTASEYVSIPGNLHVLGSSSNNTMRGTNVLPAGSDISFGRYALTSIAAGNNAAIPVGTNVFVQLSGPASAFNINGIDGQPNRDGKLLVLYNNTGFTMTLADQSGVDPVAANRILTPASSDLTLRGRSAAVLMYNSAASRWSVISTESSATGQGAASYTLNTNATVATSASTNSFSGWTYSSAIGTIGTLTNTALWVTNAGTYRIEFGAGLLATTSDVLKYMIFTNAVHCGIIQLDATMAGASAAAETGYKSLQLALPDNCIVEIRVANDSAASTTLINAVFNIQSVQ